MKDHSKNKKLSSWTARNSSLKRLAPVSDTSRTSDSDSKPPRKPSNPSTSIRSAPSPPTSPSGAKFSRVSWSPLKCKEPSSSEGTISTMSPSTTDTRRDTEISQSTAHLLSQSRKVTSSLSANADPSLKPSTSTSSRSSPTKSSAMSENNLCSSDVLMPVKYYLTHIRLLFITQYPIY